MSVWFRDVVFPLQCVTSVWWMIYRWVQSVFSSDTNEFTLDIFIMSIIYQDIWYILWRNVFFFSILTAFSSKMLLMAWDLNPQTYIYVCTVYIHTYWPLYQVHLASTGLDPFCLQNCLNSSWHRFNKVLETLLRDFGPYWHDSITQLLQICRLHIHDENLSFHHIPKMLYWIEIWWLWRTFE